MVDHVNFYENIKEANMRLNQTVVMYDGEPYYVLAICDHKPDGVFRMYLDPLGQEGGLACERMHIPYEWHSDGLKSRGQMMDEFLAANPGCGVIRKMMNSPLFNRFRPFPLGMANYKGTVYYIERTPSRHTQQGLTGSMLDQTVVSLGAVKKTVSRRVGGINFLDPTIYDVIKGKYPSPEECIKALNDPDVENDGIAFSRLFAFIRGPMDLMFLAYKREVVGLLVNNDLSSVKVAKESAFLKEVIEELNIFNEVRF